MFEMRAPTQTPATPPITPKRIEASDIDEPPHRDGAKLPAVRPKNAQKPITERPTLSRIGSLAGELEPRNPRMIHFGPVIRAPWRTVLPGALLAACALLGTQPAAASARHGLAVACSTRGLAVSAGGASGYRVVGLHAAGLSCETARGVARRVAEDLLRNRSLSFTDASGFSVSQVTCGGCRSRTDVAISYPDGSIDMSLTGTALGTPNTLLRNTGFGGHGAGGSGSAARAAPGVLTV